jgi:hypothetical protein
VPPLKILASTLTTGKAISAATSERNDEQGELNGERFMAGRKLNANYNLGRLGRNHRHRAAFTCVARDTRSLPVPNRRNQPNKRQ